MKGKIITFSGYNLPPQNWYGTNVICLMVEVSFPMKGHNNEFCICNLIIMQGRKLIWTDTNMLE
jgi:hypothetical protein